MLRSLVGSEMCIRDSQMVPCGQLPRERIGDFGALAIGLAANPEPHECIPCLLYTSDAADDLLCVDLGGRRIIKNKNNETNKYLY